MAVVALSNLQITEQIRSAIRTTKERATIEMLKDYHFYAIEGNPDEIEKGYFTEDTAYVLYTNGLFLPFGKFYH